MIQEANDRFVLQGLTGFTWDSADSVSYEAALEAIGEVVAACSRLIAAEQDPVRAAHWRTVRQQWVQRRRDLNPADSDAVARARSEAVEAAGSLGEG